MRQTALASARELCTSGWLPVSSRPKCGSVSALRGLAGWVAWSAARRGADFERRVKRRLERDGWFVVRSAGSRGPLDLVALRRDGHGGCEVRLIQCKVRQTHFTLNDWSLLEEAALDAGATAW